MPCINGLNLSVNALDALSYSTGDIVWRVRGHGTVVVERNKAACSDRTYLRGGIDVSDVVRHFARLCALDVISLWDAPDEVRTYLRTGDPTISAEAMAAACFAAGAAVWVATRDAAARDAAGDAIWARQNRRLHRMLMDAIRKDERKRMK
jgi:hypothetical protein